MLHIFPFSPANLETVPWLISISLDKKVKKNQYLFTLF
jgi:hypothetical protein